MLTDKHLAINSDITLKTLDKPINRNTETGSLGNAREYYDLAQLDAGRYDKFLQPESFSVPKTFTGVSNATNVTNVTSVSNVSNVSMTSTGRTMEVCGSVGLWVWILWLGTVRVEVESDHGHEVNVNDWHDGTRRIFLDPSKVNLTAMRHQYSIPLV